MAYIPLSQGYAAMVDDEDFPAVCEHNWCYRAERDRKQGYAVRHVRVARKDRLCYLHRQLMNAEPGQLVIFLNYDGLDCRRANLKVVTKEEARQHHRVPRDRKRASKGIRFNRDGGTWSATSNRGGHCYTIGTYYSREVAEQAYQRSVLRENPELVYRA